MEPNTVGVFLLIPSIQKEISRTVDILIKRKGLGSHAFSEVAFQIIFQEGDKPGSLDVVVLNVERRKRIEC